MQQPDAEMVPPAIPLPRGEALDELRRQQVEEALADLMVTANELRGQAELIFLALARQSAVDLPSSSFDALRFSSRSGLRQRLRGWTAGLLRRLRLLPRANARTPAGKSSRQIAGARNVESPPGCVVRVADATALPSAASTRGEPDRSNGRLTQVVLAVEPAQAGSRVEDFLLLAKRFSSDPSVRFVVSSRVDERYRRLAAFLELDNLEFRYDQGGPDQRQSFDGQSFDVCCATAEAPVQESTVGVAQRASFVVATRESGLATARRLVAAPEIGDVDGFEKALVSILERLRTPYAGGVAS
jgi:hypothetical protein